MSRPVAVAAQDRVKPLTLGLAILVIPFLAVASVLLYLLPTQTDRLFAWTITPPITAMMLASAYLGGIWFFAQVIRLRRWHRVAYGFWAVALFAGLLGAATLLHWDRFHPGHVSFITWVTLYLTTPLLAVAAILVNWREDPGTAEPRDYVIGRGLRVLLGVFGIAALGVGLLLFFFPQLAIEIWAWPVTPLTSRVVGAVLTLPGMVDVWFLLDGRWSSFRWVFQAQLISLAFIIGALVLARNDLDWTRLSAPLFVAGIAASFVGYLAFYWYCESRMRASGNPPTEPSNDGEQG
jgi:hypothetical protein